MYFAEHHSRRHMPSGSVLWLVMLALIICLRWCLIFPLFLVSILWGNPLKLYEDQSRDFSPSSPTPELTIIGYTYHFPIWLAFIQDWPGAVLISWLAYSGVVAVMSWEHSSNMWRGPGEEKLRHPTKSQHQLASHVENTLSRNNLDKNSHLRFCF